MKRNLIIITFLLATVISSAQSQYVNPFIGASTNTSKAGVYHGLGKTFPGATTPFAMVQVSPQTITGGDNGSGYSYEHTSIEGFSMTQMSGVGWYGDLGNFLVQPSVGPFHTIAGKEDGTTKGYRSLYDKKSETAKAGYYSTILTDYGIKVECSATTRCGALRFIFPKDSTSRIQIDLARRVGGTAIRQYIKVIDKNTIEGWMKCTPEGGGWGDGQGKANYTLHFHATISRPIINYGFWSAEIPDGQKRHNGDVASQEYQKIVENAKIIRQKGELEGDHIGFFTEFSTEENDSIEMKVGISFVDIEGARRNYQNEVANKNFDSIYADAVRQWDEALGCITVEGGTQNEKVIFYTALYHTMIDPRIFQDVDGRYIGADMKVHKADNGYTKRTIFSGWDVFRSQFPLQTIINPKIVNDMICSLTELAQDSEMGYYERWEFLNAYSGGMLGNPAISVLADAYIKGIRTYDIQKAYQTALNTSKKFGNNENGYTPGSISHTLEYAYSDWCMSVLAREFGDSTTWQYYLERSHSYASIYDDTHKWFRPKNNDGTWEEWPVEGIYKEGYGCCESNPLQQGWFVPHDIEGFTKLLGGREEVVCRLDSMFEKTPSTMLWNKYYNHANEPVHHVPFIYNKLGYPWKTQKWSRFICSNAYENSVEGLKGNEDVGQMSAWYVLAASGLHPICPGDTRTEITSPVFEKITFHLENNFTIIAHDNSDRNIYIQYALLNGKVYNKCYLDFNQIILGGKLELFMGPEPNKSWGK